MVSSGSLKKWTPSLLDKPNILMQYKICFVSFVDMLYVSNNLCYDPMLVGYAQALYD